MRGKVASSRGANRGERLGLQQPPANRIGQFTSALSRCQFSKLVGANKKARKENNDFESKKLALFEKGSFLKNRIPKLEIWVRERS